MPIRLPRAAYIARYGPTTGDRVRLADTELFVEVEADRTLYGEEVTFGSGQVIRDGMGQSQVTRADGAVDTVITNALILDYWGIIKADVGIRDGRISGIGKAGNPDVQPDVDIVIGPGSAVIAGECRILTAGGINAPANSITPRIALDALGTGVTTLLGGGTGPAEGTDATACTPGPWHLARMLQVAEALPVNVGLFGKGSAARPEALIEQVAGGACGLLLHEAWGTAPAVIDNCLDVADAMDVQVAIHPDTRNESGFVEHTVAAFKDRTVHALIEDAGGQGTEIARLCGIVNVLPSSADPTRPLARLPLGILHDLGAISMLSSDGRVGEAVISAWQTADWMRRERGRLPGETGDNDNRRVKRYLAKYTINPAIAHGIDAHVGSVEIGKLADLVLWRPMFFGVRPDLVLKGGMIAAAKGDSDAPSARPMFEASCLSFVSRTALDSGLGNRLGLRRRLVAVRGTRTIGKRDMVLNDAIPWIEIDPETHEVRADGELLTPKPAERLPLAQRYFLF